MKANAGIMGERGGFRGGVAFIKMEGLELKGDFEQSRSARGNSENKAACFERGRSDHF